MSRSALLLLLFLPALGCSSPEVDMQMALTSADSAFAHLLADLHEADAAALESMEAGAFAPDSSRRDSVLTANDWTESAFSERSAAYSAEPDRLLAIYNLAVDIAAGR
jgi:hypothetical protein